MVEPIGPEEQPDPIRRAAANLGHAYRYLNEQDYHAAQAMTLSGILMSLDRAVRNLGAAALESDLKDEARLLAKHADTIDRMREDISHTTRKGALLSMREAHDAMVEAAKKLDRAKPPFLPF